MEKFWPCHMKPKKEWCDHDGPGGFMGHTCDTLKNYVTTHKQWGPQDRTEKSRFLVLALCGETGELANLFKKEWRDHKPLNMEEVKKEIADIGNYLHILADHLGIDLEQAMLAKMKEVSERPVFLEAMEPKPQRLA